MQIFFPNAIKSAFEIVKVFQSVIMQVNSAGCTVNY